MTYAEALRPTIDKFSRLYDFALIIGGSLLIGLSAQISLPLPFSPVPITGQTLMVLLAGMVLGSRRGALCLIVYLAEGLSGLPVFAGATAGPAVVLGPTGGYLIGFIAAAYLTGRLAERRWDRHIVTTLLAMILGNLVIYACGLAWLATFVGPGKILPLGLFPFIPGDLLKIGVASLLLPAGWKLHVVGT
ncbi:MAG: biotin transporter BioY [Chloroflexi bacterium]|nr:biotin transporter BioY [Chloroflexota bacterium]